MSDTGMQRASLNSFLLESCQCWVPFPQSDYIVQAKVQDANQFIAQPVSDKFFTFEIQEASGVTDSLTNIVPLTD